MKKRIKFIGIFTALMLSLCVTISVSAATSDPYQEVIDKLNKEYSMDIHFITPDEKGLYSNAISEHEKIDITPEEFEKNMREQIIENNRAKLEADKKIEELEQKNIIESGSGICQSIETPTTRTKTTVTRANNVAGATVYLNATVTNSPGYWVYSSINSVSA